MITIVKHIGSIKVECYGLSTDQKPTDVGNASIFYEMDTTDVFMFDEYNKVWLKQ
jgi:hypothetical protein